MREDRTRYSDSLNIKCEWIKRNSGKINQVGSEVVMKWEKIKAG
jgi:hypothetical protein